MMARKIIVSACIVNSWLNTLALMSVEFGEANWIRMRPASRPPTRKKKQAVTR